jgi:capsular polysaccharide transport system ATP-binding protein
MIRFENVVKRYVQRGESRWILQGVNFTFPRGRSVGILGSNGAGKSTVIRMISGAEDPDFGTIRREIRTSWPIGFSGTFAGSMTGKDACLFIARLYGKDPLEIIDFVRDFSELGSYFFNPIKTYSSGMKSRLSFGISMAMNFDTYLIDEVTAVGDKPFQEKCRQAFSERRLTSDVIMVSHSERTIRDYCDMGCILADGEMTAYEDVEEAIAVYQEMLAQRTTSAFEAT